MSNSETPNIPPEILDSEKRHQAAPEPTSRYGSLGLPALPAALLDLAVQYLPILALAGAAVSGFSAFGFFIAMTSGGQTLNALQPLAAFLNVAAALVMGLSYIWLTERRRLGWNALVLAIIVQLMAQFILSGVGSILYSGIEVIITAYILLQIRDSYSQ